MEVKLLHYTPIEILIFAIRQCYDSMDKSDSAYVTLNDFTSMDACIASMKSNFKPKFQLGEKDKALIKRIIESGHTSTLEHVTFNFHLKDFTRDVLQELSRHRIASASVKSTRYTLKELKGEKDFVYYDFEKSILLQYDYETAKKYVELTGIDLIDQAVCFSLQSIKTALNKGLTNDQVKPALPEDYLVSSVYSINLRSFRNLLQLRDSNRAYPRFRRLAKAMAAAVPEEYKFTIEDCVDNG